MGEVYRARDTRLGRDVAVKVLPANWCGDPEPLRRFEQEARATAALNHANILAVFDVGQQDGSPYIVSELLEGESLRSRLRTGPLLVRKAVEYGIQIIRGLAAAHDRGIFHRDLKPENIFVTRDGHVKILDFGLAKLTLPDPATMVGLSAGPTLDSATRQGAVLGTLGYMSPEQLRGAGGDVRSDLFSFGVVLYEMLSGERAFYGKTAADTISAVLREDPPDLTASGRDVPPILERIVRHCLEKDPAARFQSARDVAFDLEALSTISSSALATAVRTQKARRTWLIPGLLGTAAVLLLVAGLLIGRLSAPLPALPVYHQLTFGRETVSSARFAPDQRTAIYSSARNGDANELFSVTPDSLASRSLGLKDTDVAAISPAGEMLLIQQQRELKDYARVGVLARAPLSGAAPRAVLNDVQDADWGPEDKIAVAHFVGERFRLEYPMGHVLYETSGYISNVRVSPKGDLVAFADHPVLGDNSGTVAVVDSSGRKRSLSAVQGIIGIAWAPSGKEVWFSGSIIGIAAQLNSVDLSGHGRVLARVPGSLAIYDIARDGRALLSHENWRASAMALGPGDSQERDLTVTDWTVVTALSPDGRQVLLGEEGSGSRSDYDIYVRSTDGSPPVRLGQGQGLDFSPDMKWVLASLSLRVPRELFLIPLGPGEPQQITKDAIDHDDARFLPNGKGVVFTGVEPGHKPRIYTQEIGGDSPHAISPEGVRGVVPTADGKFVFGFADAVALYPIDDQGAPRPIRGMHLDDSMASVSPDGRSVLVVSVTRNSMNVFRLDLASGRRVLFKKIGPADPTGIAFTIGGAFTPDGKYYAYCYGRVLDELYAVDGMR
jgi:serine/threonine protein kinase/Tol biopolymer transport system component